jgi:hypothetical protein
VAVRLDDKLCCVRGNSSLPGRKHLSQVWPAPLTWPRADGVGGR